MAQQQEKEKVVLEAAVRGSAGKGAARGLRREGVIPGIVYGEGVSSFSVQIGARDLNRALQTKAGENVLVSLRLKKDAKQISENLVLIKEMQHHPVSHQVIHVDFHQVSLTKRIIVTVPLAFKGEAAGVKKGDGVLEHLRWDLEVECLPTQIPAEIPVDVSGLELGQTLEAKTVSLPEGVRLVSDLQMPIAACVKPKAEEITPTAAVEAGAEATEPEVIKQKKPEEVAAEEAQGQGKEKPVGKEKGEEKKKEK